MGGKPSRGTPADKRLTGNRSPAKPKTPPATPKQTPRRKK